MGLTKLRAEQVSDIDYKQAVRVITVTDITNLSGEAPSQVDGVNLSIDDRILVTAQDPGSENGIYQVQTVGTGSDGTWIRTGDTNETGELEAGTIVMVTEGNSYADTQWKLTTNNPIIIGTTPLTFEQNSAFAFGNIYANGTAVLANTVGSTVTISAGNNIVIVGNNTSKIISYAVSDNISIAGNILTQGLISASGAITGASITGSSLTVSNGNVTCGNIVNANANGVGNIGSATTYFNTVFAKATSAQYADLAEMYVADSNYAPGTVVEFGGVDEVTITTQSHSTKVAGIVSTNPSYLMNATQSGNTVVPVALTGRVPCSVVGTIEKGDRLVASDLPGVAQPLDPSQYQPACIIGKALENYNSDHPGIIEVAVGRT